MLGGGGGYLTKSVEHDKSYLLIVPYGFESLLDQTDPKQVIRPQAPK